VTIYGATALQWALKIQGPSAIYSLVEEKKDVTGMQGVSALCGNEIEIAHYL
jgi:hypothetical protein